MVPHFIPPVVSKIGLAVRESLAAPLPEAPSFTFSAHSRKAPDTPVDYACRHYLSETHFFPQNKVAHNFELV